MSVTEDLDFKPPIILLRILTLTSEKVTDERLFELTAHNVVDGMALTVGDYHVRGTAETHV